MGETEIAQKYVLAQVAAHKITKKDYNFIFHYYAKNNLYIDFFKITQNMELKEKNLLFKKNPNFFFPQPFQKQVNKTIKELKFDKNIIYSIMRQESAFNPLARSHADAFGLLQLIPEVASKISARVKTGYKNKGDLFNPQININTGSAHLKDQWKKFDNSFILATASYNAREEAIKGWLKSRFDGNTLYFIEDIPYEETRNYIKLVMRNYLIYSSLNNEKSIYFPEELLDIKVKKI